MGLSYNYENSWESHTQHIATHPVLNWNAGYFNSLIKTFSVEINRTHFLIDMLLVEPASYSFSRFVDIYNADKFESFDTNNNAFPHFNRVAIATADIDIFPQESDKRNNELSTVGRHRYLLHKRAKLFGLLHNCRSQIISRKKRNRSKTRRKMHCCRNSNITITKKMKHVIKYNFYQYSRPQSNIDEGDQQINTSDCSNSETSSLSPMMSFLVIHTNKDGDVNANARGKGGEVITPELKKKMEIPWWTRSRKTPCDTLFFSPVSTPTRDKDKRVCRIAAASDVNLEKRRKERANRTKPWKVEISEQLQPQTYDQQQHEQQPLHKQQQQHLHKQQQQKQNQYNRHPQQQHHNSKQDKDIAATNRGTRSTSHTAHTTGQRLLQNTMRSKLAAYLEKNHNDKALVNPTQHEQHTSGRLNNVGISRDCLKNTNPRKDSNSKLQPVQNGSNNTVAIFSQQDRKTSVAGDSENAAAYFDAYSASESSANMMYTPLQENCSDTQHSSRLQLTANPGNDNDHFQRLTNSQILATPLNPLGRHTSTINPTTQEISVPNTPQDIFPVTTPFSPPHQHMSCFASPLPNWKSPMAISETDDDGKHNLINVSPGLQEISPFDRTAYLPFMAGRRNVPSSNPSKSSSSKQNRHITELATSRNRAMKNQTIQDNRTIRSVGDDSRVEIKGYETSELSPKRASQNRLVYDDGVSHQRTEKTLISPTTISCLQLSLNDEDVTEQRTSIKRKTQKNSSSIMAKEDSRFSDQHQHHNHQHYGNPNRRNTLRSERRQCPSFVPNADIMLRRNISQSIPSLMQKVNHDIEKKVRSMVDSYSRFLMAEKGIILPPVADDNIETNKDVKTRKKNASGLDATTTKHNDKQSRIDAKNQSGTDTKTEQKNAVESDRSVLKHFMEGESDSKRATQQPITRKHVQRSRQEIPTKTIHSRGNSEEKTQPLHPVDESMLTAQQLQQQPPNTQPISLEVLEGSCVAHESKIAVLKTSYIDVKEEVINHKHEQLQLSPKYCKITGKELPGDARMGNDFDDDEDDNELLPKNQNEINEMHINRPREECFSYKKTVDSTEISKKSSMLKNGKHATISDKMNVENSNETDRGFKDCLKLGSKQIAKVVGDGAARQTKRGGNVDRQILNSALKADNAFSRWAYTKPGDIIDQAIDCPISDKPLENKDHKTFQQPHTSRPKRSNSNPDKKGEYFVHSEHLPSHYNCHDFPPTLLSPCRYDSSNERLSALGYCSKSSSDTKFAVCGADVALADNFIANSCQPNKQTTKNQTLAREGKVEQKTVKQHQQQLTTANGKKAGVKRVWFPHDLAVKDDESDSEENTRAHLDSLTSSWDDETTESCHSYRHNLVDSYDSDDSDDLSTDIEGLLKDESGSARCKNHGHTSKKSSQNNGGVGGESDSDKESAVSNNSSASTMRNIPDLEGNDMSEALTPPCITKNNENKKADNGASNNRIEKQGRDCARDINFSNKRAAASNSAPCISSCSDKTSETYNASLSSSKSVSDTQLARHLLQTLKRDLKLGKTKTSKRKKRLSLRNREEDRTGRNNTNVRRERENIQSSAYSSHQNSRVSSTNKSKSIQVDYRGGRTKCSEHNVTSDGSCSFFSIEESTGSRIDSDQKSTNSEDSPKSLPSFNEVLSFWEKMFGNRKIFGRSDIPRDRRKNSHKKHNDIKRQEKFKHDLAELYCKHSLNTLINNSNIGPPNGSHSKSSGNECSENFISLNDVEQLLSPSQHKRKRSIASVTILESSPETMRSKVNNPKSGQTKTISTRPNLQQQQHQQHKLKNAQPLEKHHNSRHNVGSKPRSTLTNTVSRSPRYIDTSTSPYGIVGDIASTVKEKVVNAIEQIVLSPSMLIDHKSRMERVRDAVVLRHKSKTAKEVAGRNRHDRSKRVIHDKVRKSTKTSRIPVLSVAKQAYVENHSNQRAVNPNMDHNIIQPQRTPIRSKSRQSRIHHKCQEIRYHDQDDETEMYYQISSGLDTSPSFCRDSMHPFTVNPPISNRRTPQVDLSNVTERKHLMSLFTSNNTTPTANRNKENIHLSTTHERDNHKSLSFASKGNLHSVTESRYQPMYSFPTESHYLEREFKDSLNQKYVNNDSIATVQRPQENEERSPDHDPVHNDTDNSLVNVFAVDTHAEKPSSQTLALPSETSFSNGDYLKRVEGNQVAMMTGVHQQLTRRNRHRYTDDHVRHSKSISSAKENNQCDDLSISDIALRESKIGANTHRRESCSRNDMYTIPENQPVVQPCWKENAYSPTIELGQSPTNSRYHNSISKKEFSAARAKNVLESPRSDTEHGKHSVSPMSKPMFPGILKFPIGGKDPVPTKATLGEKNSTSPTHSVKRIHEESKEMVDASTEAAQVEIPGQIESIRTKTAKQEDHVFNKICMGSQTTVEDLAHTNVGVGTNSPKMNKSNRTNLTKMVQTSPTMTAIKQKEVQGHISHKGKQTVDTTLSMQREMSSFTEDPNLSSFESRIGDGEHARHKEWASKDTISSSTHNRGSGDGVPRDQKYDAIAQQKAQIQMDSYGGDSRSKPKGRITTPQQYVKNDKRSKKQRHSNKRQSGTHLSTSEQNLIREPARDSSEESISKRQLSSFDFVKVSSSDTDIMSQVDHKFESYPINRRIELSTTSKAKGNHYSRPLNRDDIHIGQKHRVESLASYVQGKEQRRKNEMKPKLDHGFSKKFNKRRDGRGIEIVLGEGLPVDKFVNSFIGGLQNVKKQSDNPVEPFKKTHEKMRLPKQKAVVVQLNKSPIREFPFKGDQYCDYECHDQMCSNPDNSRHGHVWNDFRKQTNGGYSHPFYPHYADHRDNFTNHIIDGESDSFNRPHRRNRRQIFENSSKRQYRLQRSPRRDIAKMYGPGVMTSPSERTNTITDSKTCGNDYSSRGSNDNHCVVNNIKKSDNLVQLKSQTIYTNTRKTESEATKDKERKTTEVVDKLPEKTDSHTLCVTAPCSFPLKGRTVNATLTSDPGTNKKQVLLRFVDSKTSKTSRIIVEPDSGDEPSWPNVVSKNGNVFVTFHQEDDAKSNNVQKDKEVLSKPPPNVDSNRDATKEHIKTNYGKDRIARASRNASKLENNSKMKNHESDDSQERHNSERKSNKSRHRHPSTERDETITGMTDSKRPTESSWNVTSSGSESSEIDSRKSSKGKRNRRRSRKERLKLKTISPATSFEIVQRSKGKEKHYRLLHSKQANDDGQDVTAIEDRKRPTYVNRNDDQLKQNIKEINAASIHIINSRHSPNNAPKLHTLSNAKNELHGVQLNEEIETKKCNTAVNTLDQATEKLLSGNMQYFHQSKQDLTDVNEKQTLSWHTDATGQQLPSEPEANPSGSILTALEKHLSFIQKQIHSHTLQQQQQQQSSQEQKPQQKQQQLQQPYAQAQAREQNALSPLEQTTTTTSANLNNTQEEQAAHEVGKEKTRGHRSDLENSIIKGAVMKVVSENVTKLYSDTERSASTRTNQASKSRDVTKNKREEEAVDKTRKRQSTDRRKSQRRRSKDSPSSEENIEDTPDEENEDSISKILKNDQSSSKDVKHRKQDLRENTRELRRDISDRRTSSRYRKGESGGRQYESLLSKGNSSNRTSSQSGSRSPVQRLKARFNNKSSTRKNDEETARASSKDRFSTNGYEHYLKKHKIKTKFSSSSEEDGDGNESEKYDMRRNYTKKSDRDIPKKRSYNHSDNKTTSRNDKSSAKEISRNPSNHSIESQDSFMGVCDQPQVTPMKGPFSIRQYSISHSSTHNGEQSHFYDNYSSSGPNTPNNQVNKSRPSTSSSKEKIGTPRVWWKDQESPATSSLAKYYTGSNKPSFQVSKLPNGRNTFSVYKDSSDSRSRSKDRATRSTPAADRFLKRVQGCKSAVKFDRNRFTLTHRKISALRDRSLSSERTGGGGSSSGYNSRTKSVSPFGYNSYTSVQSGNTTNEADVGAIASASAVGGASSNSRVGTGRSGGGGAIGDSKPIDAWDRAVVDKLKCIRQTALGRFSRETQRL